jgi:hypothetical protein
MLQGLERDAGRSLSNKMLQRLLRFYGHNCGIAEVNRLENSALVIAELLRPGIDMTAGFVRAEGIDPPLAED